MKYRPFVAILLALLLVLTQQAGFAHGVSHVPVKVGSDDPSLPQHSKVCDQCNQASDLFGGLTAKPLVVLTLSSRSTFLPTDGSTPLRLPFPPFSARAPPSLHALSS